MASCRASCPTASYANRPQEAELGNAPSFDWQAPNSRFACIWQALDWLAPNWQAPDSWFAFCSHGSKRRVKRGIFTQHIALCSTCYA